MAEVRRAGYPDTCRTFATKTEAKEWAIQIEGAIQARRHGDPSLAEIELGVALERYERTVTAAKAASTRDREGRTIKSLLRGLGPETLLTRITPQVVARYRDDRLAEVSAYSVRLELALLSHLYRRAIREWELPLTNPVDSVDRPAPPRGRMRFLKELEIETLLDQCRRRRNPLLYPLVLVLLHTAMRPGEAMWLRAGQVDVPARHITLIDTKNKDPRRVPLTARAVEALAPLVQGRPPDHYLFMTPAQAAKGAKIHGADIFRESFNRARQAAGFDWLHMHDLRHTAASWMLMRGVDMRTLAAILGHRTLQMVLRYTHLVDDHQRAAVERIGDLGVVATG